VGQNQSKSPRHGVSFKDGVRVYGFIRDAGSHDGAGMNRIRNILLRRQ
jgi:hypothetical protein